MGLFSRNSGKRKAPTNELALAALAQSSAKIMIADYNYTIVYMNKAVTQFLTQVEHDVRQQLPSFQVSKLIGQNIDIFHRNPEHQREMLEQLRDRFATTIRVSQHTFDLLAQPIFDARQHRIGTFVEWNDASLRLQNEDYQAQIEGISRSQAVISFTANGTVLGVNDIFTQLLGYSKDEITGKHHRMLVDDATAKSKEYEELWERLSKGHPTVKEIKHLSKSGKVVWLIANYNPIRNAKGEVVKIVKYASDITREMITRQSNERIREMLESTAAASEELSISVREISNSMQQSSSDSQKAANMVAAAEEETKRLDDSANAMSGLLEIITCITDQINLLALNATIESARAGDAGKGFAVVASEVKNLASQAATSGERITKEVDGLRKISTQVIDSLKEISQSIRSLQQHITGIASAIEQQTQVTNEMSASMAHAAEDARKQLVDLDA